MPVTLTIQLPEELAETLQSHGTGLERAALESLVIEAYRENQISDLQLRRILGLNRFQADTFLKDHSVWLDYTSEDLANEGEVTRVIIHRNQ